MSGAFPRPCFSTHGSPFVKQLIIAKPGLERYLNSTLLVGQVTLNFCLSGALPRLPKFSNSLIIHKPKDGSHT